MTDDPDGDALADSITAALQDYVTAEGGGMVTAYHVVAEWIDTGGEHRWMYVTPTEQRQSTTMGLLDWSRGVARYEQQRYLDSITEG